MNRRKKNCAFSHLPELCFLKQIYRSLAMRKVMKMTAVLGIIKAEGGEVKLCSENCIPQSYG